MLSYIGIPAKKKIKQANTKTNQLTKQTSKTSKNQTNPKNPAEDEAYNKKL